MVSASKVRPSAKPAKAPIPTGKPEFLTDLDAMLSRGSARPVGSSRVPASVVSRSLPAGTRSGATRIYTAPETIFESITQATAFDAAEIDTNVPTDRAAQLFASGNVPAAYHAAVHSGPMPLNRNISAFKHNPLYYEERNLERCGNGYGCATTAVSAARFAGTTLALPVLLLSEFPGDCVPGGPDCPTCTELFVD